MKRLNILLLSILFFSCQDKKEETPASADNPIEDSIAEENPVPTYNPESKLYVWRTTDDYRKIKNELAGPAIVNADSLIKGLNEYYEKVHIEKVKLSGDTLYTSIKEADYLTQQMGTTGAEMYLADVVLNLTTVPGVKFVNIDLQEGDHMQPGTWSQDNFKKYKEATQQ
ncbi:MAG: hypothetical protein EOO06_12525 [Chitinophagaceae bacterium]|nr:MAG: hypothetical protein EOO06_12525 [Chitinophagaceae bacterium]